MSKYEAAEIGKHPSGRFLRYRKRIFVLQDPEIDPNDRGSPKSATHLLTEAKLTKEIVQRTIFKNPNSLDSGFYNTVSDERGERIVLYGYLPETGIPLNTETRMETVTIFQNKSPNHKVDAPNY